MADADEDVGAPIHHQSVRRFSSSSFIITLYPILLGAFMRIPNIIAVSFITLLIITLQGCGRKGPLFLEAPKPAAVAPPQKAQPLAIHAQSQPVSSPTLQNQPEPKK